MATRTARIGARIARASTAAAYWAGARLAPRTAARSAAKLWCRLPRNAGRRQDNRRGPGCLEMVPIPGDRHLAVETWGQDSAPLVYLVHGWGGWRGQLGAFVGPLVEAGFRVLAFDSMSHGESDPGPHGPNHSSGGEMIDSLEAVAAIYGPAAGVIAHSLGCATSARALVNGTFHADRLCFVAPSPDMAAIARIYGRTLAFPERVIDLMIADMAAWAKRPMGSFDLTAMAATGALPPGLLVHDVRDKESRYRTAEEIHAAWEGGDLMTTEGYGHHRILLAPLVHAACVAMIAGAA